MPDETLHDVMVRVGLIRPRPRPLPPSMRPAWESTPEATQPLRMPREMLNTNMLAYERPILPQTRAVNRDLAQLADRQSLGGPRGHADGREAREFGQAVLEATGIPSWARGIEDLQYNNPGDALPEFAMGGLQTGSLLFLPVDAAIAGRAPRAPMGYRPPMLPMAAEATPRLPNAPPRLPGRATDGSVLPIRPPEPIRQSIVGGSDDLAEAASMRQQQAPDAGQSAREQLRAEGFDVEDPLYRGHEGDPSTGHWRASEGMNGEGVYLTRDPASAERWARRQAANNPTVHTIYARGRIADSRDGITFEEAQAQGYSGLHYYENGQYVETVVFDPANVSRSVGRRALNAPDGGASAVSIRNREVATQANARAARSARRLGTDGPQSPDGGASGAGNQSAWARVKDAVLGRAPDIEANIWIGPRSALWDADRAARAEAMAQQGASPQEIWRETGTFRGSDGKWRQETGLVPFSRAYPNARAHVRREIFDQGGGSYAPIGPFNLISGTEPRALSHELNHLASRIEGFAPGGNPIRAGIEAKLRGEQFRGAYDRLPGEMDAERAAQRYHLNDEQRVERFPGVISREERMRQSAGLTQSPDGGASGAGQTFYRGVREGDALSGEGPIYLHRDPSKASEYAGARFDASGRPLIETTGEGGNVARVTANIRNPIEVSQQEIAALGYEPYRIREMMQRGYDAAIAPNGEVLVFDRNGVRPAIGRAPDAPNSVSRTDGGASGAGNFGETPFFRGSVHDIDPSQGPNNAVFFTPSRDFAGEFPRAVPAEQRQVGEYRLREDRIADMRDPATQQRVLAELASDPDATAHLQRRIGQMRDKATGHVDWVISADPAIRDAIERAGYQGVWLDEGKGQASVAVFDRSAIRRAPDAPNHLNDEQRVERFPGVISREERMRQSAGLTQSPDGGASGAGNAYREQLRAEGFNVDEPVYHGTNADFEHFDPARASGQGMYGDGAGYFATAPQWANEFARGEGANVRQVYVRGNIFDTGRHTASHRGSPALIADYARLYQQKGMDFAASGIERHLQNGNFLAAYQQAVRDLGTFAELGYDGVRGASSLAGDEIVVFSPDNIAPRWRAPDAPNASPPHTSNKTPRPPPGSRPPPRRK